MRTFHLFCAAALGVAALGLPLNPLQAASVFKANNANNLNLGTAWSGGVTPTSADVAVWDSTVTAANTVLLGANTNWSGIKILDPAGLVTISAGNLLTLGVAGIDMSLATNSLTLACAVSNAVAQTWNVTNGLTLTASGGLTNLGSAFLTIGSGGGTVNLTGVGSGAAGVVNNGTLQMTAATGSGTGAITNNNGSTFRINTSTTLANVMNFSGTVTIDLNNVANNQGIGSPGAISGAGNVTFINQNVAAVRTFTLGGSSSSMANFSGSFSIGTNNGIFRFNDGGGNGNTGSSTMLFDLGSSTATLLERNRNGSVNLGALTGGSGTKITQGSSSSGTTPYTIGGRNTPCQFDGTISDGGVATAGVSITKTGTSTFTLTGPNTYVGGTTVSGGTLFVGGGTATGALGTGAIVNNATLTFNRTGDFTNVNNISGSGTTSQQGGGTLTYSGTNTSSGTLLISTGVVALAASGLISAPIFLATNTIFNITNNPAFAFNQTVSGFGAIVGAATNIGGTISPGGVGAAGTLTYSNGLTETGNVTHQLELSTVAGTNDLISIVGDLTVSATNPIIITKFGGGTLANGTYPLFSYTGSFNGGLTNFSVSVSGVTATLANPANQIVVIISPATRGATNLTWVGDGVNNWDVGTSTNWVNGANLFNFQAGDSVRFDNTGAANPTVTLSAANLLLPASVVVNAANDYTFTGAGAISGSTGLTKTNTGTLSVQTTNSYTGPTVVGKGTLEINSVANGNSPSALGQSISDPTNLVLNGSTLRYTGPSAGTDRGATLSGSGGAIEIPSGNLTFTTTPLVGAGALTKIGAGTLTLNVPNTYTGGTVISNGVLALGANNANYDGGSGSALGATTNPVTFKGGTLQLFGYAGSTANNYSRFLNPLIVPAGQTGTLRMFPRGPVNTGNNSGLGSSLTGGGTLNLVINYVRDNYDGDWSAFTGTINVTPKNATGDEFRINNTFGYSNAIINLNDNVLMDRATTANATIDIGELNGTSLAVIGQGNTTAAAPTWRVGWKGTSSTFDGNIGTDSSLTKVGAGTFTLTGNNTYTGTTTVSGGTLALTVSGAIGSSTTIDVQSGAFLDVSALATPTLTLGTQTLKGNGTVNGNVDGSGTISPGASIGTLTITNVATLGGTLYMELNRTNGAQTNDILAAASIVYGGTLTVTNTGSNLVAGDRFVLFHGPFSGTFGTVDLPSTSNDGSLNYTWTNKLNLDGSIQVLTVVSSVNQTPTNLLTSVSGNTLTLSWPADHIGWRLQVQTNGLAIGLNTNWSDVAGASATNSVDQAINPANGSVFYRMIYP